MTQAHVSTAPQLKMGVAIPNGKLGMWLFLGTEIMFFTAFIGTYLVVRIGSPGWPTDTHVTHINVLMGGTNTFVLILSSYFVVLAHEAMFRRKFEQATKWVTLTMILAFVFLGIKTFEYKGKFDHDILPGRIPESNQQALEKLVNHLDLASGVLALEDTQANIQRQIALGEGDEKTLSAELETVNKQLDERKPYRQAYADLALKVSASRAHSRKSAPKTADLYHEG